MLLEILNILSIIKPEMMVLNISLCTMNLATSVIKQALENVRYIDLKDWSSQVFGQSMLSQRKIVFSTWDNDTEFA